MASWVLNSIYGITVEKVGFKNEEEQVGENRVLVKDEFDLLESCFWKIIES